MNVINGSRQKLTLSPAHTPNFKSLFFSDGGRRRSGIKAIMLLHFLLYISGMGEVSEIVRTGGGVDYGKRTCVQTTIMIKLDWELLILFRLPSQYWMHYFHITVSLHDMKHSGPLWGVKKLSFSEEKPKAWGWHEWRGARLTCWKKWLTGGAE